MIARGILYVMSTAVPGLIKIGRTGSSRFEERMYNLEKNGYSNVTALTRQFAIEVDGYIEKEALLHNIFSKSRIGQTELFAADLEMVIQLLSAFDGKKIYPKEGTKEDAFENAVEKQEEEESGLLPSGIYTISSNRKGFGKIEAKLEIKNGKLMLKKGSICAPSEYESAYKYRKNALIIDNVLQKDLPCSSVSIAGIVVLGNNVNGWRVWKDSNGKPIDSYRTR